MTVNTNVTRAPNSQYVSALYGESVVYQITGEESRAIISNQEKGSEVLVSKAAVLNEYLVTVKVRYNNMCCFSVYVYTESSSVAV